MINNVLILLLNMLYTIIAAIEWVYIILMIIPAVSLLSVFTFPLLIIKKVREMTQVMLHSSIGKEMTK